MANDTKHDFAFNKQNFIYLIAGLVIVLVGYLLMMGGGTDDPTKFFGDQIFSFRRITLAPMMVVAGYIVVLYAIMKKPPKEDA